MIDVYKYLLPHPNRPLYKGREPDFSCFPPLQGGIKGGNNVIKITANYFTNNLLANINLMRKVYECRNLDSLG